LSARDKARVSELDFSKNGGLVTVVVQDAESKDVLMLAHADREAIERTIREGLAYFYSRSRGGLWLKGESSGNYMRVLDVLVDCDGDAVIYRVVPTGPACHLGTRSCFTKSLTMITDSANRVK